MFNFIRSIVGHAPAQHGRSPTPPLRTQEKPLPIEACLTHEDTSSADFFEQYYAISAKDGCSMLVFSRYYLSESSTGKAIYDDWAMQADEHDDHPQRLENASRMYEHIFERCKPHSRIVKYLGRTASGYRLERLCPGAFCVRFPSVRGHDAVLALYQRWALQILSALVTIHASGVELNSISQEGLWLRDDFSIAVCGLFAAGCPVLGIEPGDWNDRTIGPCRWSYWTRAPYEEWAFTPKLDLFDWATIIFTWMTDGQHPLQNQKGGTEIAENGLEWQFRGISVERDEYRDWPVLGEQMLGPQLIKAWNGEYATAQEALDDVRATLEKNGRKLSKNDIDGIDEFEWISLFEVAKDEWGPDQVGIRRTRDEHQPDISDPIQDRNHTEKEGSM